MTKPKFKLDPERAKVVYDDIERTRAARAMLKALTWAEKYIHSYPYTQDQVACLAAARAAIKLAEEAGITTGEE